MLYLVFKSPSVISVITFTYPSLNLHIIFIWHRSASIRNPPTTIPSPPPCPQLPREYFYEMKHSGSLQVHRHLWSQKMGIRFLSQKAIAEQVTSSQFQRCQTFPANLSYSIQLTLISWKHLECLWIMYCHFQEDRVNKGWMGICLNSSWFLEIHTFRNSAFWKGVRKPQATFTLH